MIKTIAAVTLLAMPGVCAQEVVSARSGLIHHVEGEASAAGKPVEVKLGQFPEVKEGETFETADGRAEILLNPGVFLRLGPHSSFRMISSQLADTHVEILRGLAMVEVEELVKGNQIVIRVGESEIRPVKRGLYEIDAEGRLLRVFEGQARATLYSASIDLKSGRQTPLYGSLQSTKFDRNQTDSLYAWSSGRSALIAQANMNVARTLPRGYRGASVWAWYPALGMYTFLPGAGIAYSPFGWYLYSPRVIHSWYFPVYTSRPAYGAGGTRPSSGWTSRPSTAGASRSAGSAARSGSIGRSSGGGGARGGGRGR